MLAPSAPDALPPIDAAAAGRTQRRLGGAVGLPWLQQEIAARMAQRLPWVQAKPARVLDWSLAAPDVAPTLQAAYPEAAITRVLQARAAPEVNAAPDSTQGWWAAWRSRMGWASTGGKQTARPMSASDVAPQSADLVWSVLLLGNHADPLALLAQWRQALAPGGFLMCATLGLGSFAWLQALYSEAGWGTAHAPLPDLHDLGDAMLRAGFSGPVVDQETITLSYAKPERLLADLRCIGANLASERYSGLRTPRWRERLMAALAARAGDDGRIAMPVEVVYGHAFCMDSPKAAEGAGLASVSLGQLRATLPSQRR